MVLFFFFKNKNRIPNHFFLLKTAIHMSQIAEELTFAVLSVTKLENSWCSWEFLKVSQEAKVAPFLSAWPSTATTILIGHRGCLKNAKKWSFYGTILSFL